MHSLSNSELLHLVFCNRQIQHKKEIGNNVNTCYQMTGKLKFIKNTELFLSFSSNINNRRISQMSFNRA